jgi:hypothetical protein
MLLAEGEEYAQAIEAFEQVCALAPADAAPHFNVAFLLQQRGPSRGRDSALRARPAGGSEPRARSARPGGLARSLEKGPAWRA